MSENGPRVLVVDDEPAIRRFLRTSLAAHDYVVFEAVNGQEALAAVVAHRPDLIILDLGLPDIDGIEVTRLLREWSADPHHHPHRPGTGSRQDRRAGCRRR